MSPAGWEYLHRTIQPAHPTSQFFSIDAGELERWILRFLASLADKPSWENTVSLVNEHNQTLAHLAVLSRYTTLLKKVAQWGIDVDVQDMNGFTALHCAYLCGDLDSVGILKGYGADEDIQDDLGRRPLDMYTLSTSDPGGGSPSSDCTSSSAQGPTPGEGDCETVSMASSQPSSFSSHEGTMDLPASRHQPLHMRQSATNSSVMRLVSDGHQFFEVPTRSSSPFDHEMDLTLPSLVATLSTPTHPLPSPATTASSRAPPAVASNPPSPVPLTLCPLTLETVGPLPPISQESAREVIKNYISTSAWFTANEMEPRVGDVGVPECARLLARPGDSIWTCFFKRTRRNGILIFKCVSCAHKTDRFDRAVDHQRVDWGHRPFACTDPGW